jgi:hypothetical protein
MTPPPKIPYAGCHCWLCSLVREYAALAARKTS